MTAAYNGEAGDDYDALLNRLSETGARDNPIAIEALYDSDNLRVPAGLIDEPTQPSETQPGAHI